MVKNLKILNRKAVKEILALIEKQWDAEIDLDCVFLQDKEGKIFIINKEFAEIDLTKLRVNSMGLYIAQLMPDGIRLSIEGSQLIGLKAKKNILELTEKQAKEWFQGNDIEIKTEMKNYVILKHNKIQKIENNYLINSSIDFLLLPFTLAAFIASLAAFSKSTPNSFNALICICISCSTIESIFCISSLSFAKVAKAPL